LKISNGFLSSQEFISGVYLNYTGDATLLDFGTATIVGSLTSPTINTGSDAFKADGDGFFDIFLDFGTTAPRFGQGDSISWVISGATAAQFDALSVGSGNSPDGLFAAAHVQGIGLDGEGSGWVTIPEPSTYLAAALLLLPFGVSALRVLRKQNC
jgi:hypothetical protein